LDFIVARERDAVKGNIWKFAELSHEQLQSSAFKQIAGQARDAIILIDKDGSVQYWNTHAESIFGFASSEVIGKPLVDLIIPERYKESHLAGLARYSKTRESRVMGQLIDITGRRKDGEEVQIELMLSCVDPGDDPRYCAFIRERLS
jgi:PAS domain S-box-containing protein